MKRSVIFLQLVIVLIGLSVLAFLLIEPHFEGRNANATAFQIYFNDPFLVYAYIASLPFFTILFQTNRLLNSIRRTEELPAKAFQTIKRCSFAIILFAFGGAFWIMQSQSDDKPPAFILAFIISLFAVIVMVLASKFERFKTR